MLGPRRFMPHAQTIFFSLSLWQLALSGRLTPSEVEIAPDGQSVARRHTSLLDTWYATSDAGGLPGWTSDDVQRYFQTEATDWAHPDLLAKIANFDGPQLLSLLQREMGKEANAVCSEQEWEMMRLNIWSDLHRRKRSNNETSVVQKEASELPSKVSDWLVGKGIGLDEVELWDVEEVRWFFQKIAHESIARKMALDLVDGPKLVEMLKTFSATTMAKYDIKDEQAWNDIRLELWAVFHKNEPDTSEDWKTKAARESAEASNKNRCKVCDNFGLTHSVGFQWDLFPAPVPKPTLAHTWMCDPLKWEEVPPLSQNATPFEVESIKGESMLNRFLKKSKFKLGVIAKYSRSLKFLEPLKTMLSCGLCGLCLVWEKLKEPLRALEEKWRRFKATASDKNKYAYRHEYDKLRMSLFEAFHKVDRKRDGSPLDTSFLQQQDISSLSVNELVMTGDKLLADCWKVVDHTEEKTYDALDAQMGHLLLPATRPEPATLRTSSVHASSLYQNLEGVHMVPKECQDKLDPRKNFKRYRSAFSWGIMITLPKMEEVFKNLITLQWASVLEALLPVISLMIAPQVHKVAECVAGQKEAKETLVLTCTPQHLGMCNAAMKYQMLTEMVEAEWPPMESPGFWKRRKVTKALSTKVNVTCLTTSDFSTWKNMRLKTMANAQGEEGAVIQETNLGEDFEDCKLIKRKVREVDFTSEGQALYSPKIWFAAAQAWFLNNYNKDDNTEGTATFYGANEPNVDAFTHQFCSALLHCENKPDMEWNKLLESFEDHDSQASDATNVKLRQQMYDFWEAKHIADFPTFDLPERTAITGLGDVYKDSIKPLFVESLDLDRNPFVPPPPMQPELVDIWQRDISVKDVGVSKFDLVKSWHKRWLFIDSRVEGDCTVITTMHAKTDDSACKKLCTSLSDQDRLCVMDAKNTEKCETLSRKDVATCRMCLSWKVSYLVDIKTEATKKSRAFSSLYEIDHPVQTNNGKEQSDGVNRYVVLHGYFDKPHKNQDSNLRQFWIKPMVSGANAKWQWISRVLATARETGACPCVEDKLRDYMDQQPCANTLSIDGSDDLCVAKHSTAPGAICWSEKDAAKLMIDLEPGKPPLPAEHFVRSVACFPNIKFAESARACAALGMSFAPLWEKATSDLLSQFRQMIKIGQPDRSWSVEKLADRIRALQVKGDLTEKRIEASLNCLENVGALRTRPLLLDHRFRVWTQDKKKKLKADEQDLSGSFKVDFDTCRARSIADSRAEAETDKVLDEVAQG